MPEAGRPAFTLRRALAIGAPGARRHPSTTHMHCTHCLSSHTSVGLLVRTLVSFLGVVIATTAPTHAGEFANAVLSYSQGSNAANGYTNPLVALGAPERFTGEGIDPSAVTPFQPCFLNTEVVSIGSGGSLTLAFDPPLVDHPGNPFGVDFIVFGNSFFTDGAYPNGSVSALAADGGTIEVTADGTHWIAVPSSLADGLFPTMGWVDALPYSSSAGTIAADPRLPVDPAWMMNDLIGLSYADLVARYAGSAGGSGVDLAGVGLTQAIAVRISVAAGFYPNVEIDAVARVRPATHPADIDGNGAVDGLDLAAVLSAFGSASATADIDHNGVVDGPDLAAILAGWSG